VDLRSAPDHPAVPARNGDEWTWPPGGPLHPAEGVRWATEDWAPATTVRRPLVRVGRWTVLYRRCG
jgi:hypothetical protein